MSTNEIEAIIRDIGQSIKSSRKAKKISAAELALAVGMGRMTINRIEAGDPGVSLAGVMKVAGALAVDLDIKSMMKPESILLKIMQIQVGKPQAPQDILVIPDLAEDQVGMTI